MTIERDVVKSSTFGIGGRSLAWPDARHVMVFTQVGEVLVELLNPFFMRLNTFTFQSLVKLRLN